MADDGKKGSARRAKQVRVCPICGKPSVPDFYPFCSQRCADVDLNRWLSGAYVIPSRPEEDEDESGDEEGGSRKPDGDDGSGSLN